MPDIQGGRWEGLLTRLFPLKGPVAPVLSPELVPTVAVQPFEAEMYRLVGWRLMFGRGAQGNVAANYSEVNLRNDSSDSLVVVTGLVAATGTAATGISLYRGNTAFGTAQTIAPRDGRIGYTTTAGSVAGVVRLSAEAGITGGPGFTMRVSAANVSVNFSAAMPVVLFPGDSLIVWNETVNQSLFASFAWRERVFEPGEDT